MSPTPRPSHPEPPRRRPASPRPVPLRSLDFVASGSRNRCCRQKRGEEARAPAGAARARSCLALAGPGHPQFTHRSHRSTHTLAFRGPQTVVHEPQRHRGSQPTQGRALRKHSAQRQTQTPRSTNVTHTAPNYTHTHTHTHTSHECHTVIWTYM